MKTTDLCKKIAISVTTLTILAGPAFAQSDSDRVAELEKQMLILAEQLSELRSELDVTKQAGESAEIESL